MAEQREGQEASSSGGWREKDDSVLLAAGFEPAGGEMWQKEGVLFGREAALQYAVRELRDKKAQFDFLDQA